MTTSEIMKLVKSAGLYPIPVESGADSDVKPDLMFSGSIEDFFEAAKALGAKAIFLFASKLGEEDFQYDSDFDSENDDDGSDEEGEDSEDSAAAKVSFDLTVALPSLADFRRYIGQEYQFLLTAKSQLAALSFYLPESWWDSFEEHRANAIRKVEEDREAIRDKMEQQRLKKEDELLAKTRNLLDDSEFCRITTQRGMKAYSLEKFPELESVDDSRLTQEIQKLSDKAKARKRK